MPHEIKGDSIVRGNARARSTSLESLTTETVDGGSLALSASSPSNVFLTGSAQNFSVILGSADTYKTGHQYHFLNESSQTIQIKDFAGQVLDTVVSKTSITTRLHLNQSASGVWFFDRVPLSKVLIDTTRMPSFSDLDAQSFIESFLSIAGIQVVNEQPTGAKNGENISYGTHAEYIEGSLEVYFTGLKLVSQIDYEETSDRQGFRLIIDADDSSRLSSPPLNFESLQVNYKRRVIFS